MKILIDGDGCPVISLVERIAREYGVSCHIYCNTAARFRSRYSDIHVTDKSRDAADLAIINACDKNDIVITSDSGLAAMVLSKNGIPVTPKGVRYTDQNIIMFLNSRYVNSETRRKSRRKQVRGRLYEYDSERSTQNFASLLRKECAAAYV